MSGTKSLSYPLVSVIIRSMDRATLQDALDFVGVQTYPNIEVVLVNAKGADHREMGEWCGRFPMRFVTSSEKLSRSRAANAGLDSAQGDYLIFLDDDDWFEFDHIQKLADAIMLHPEFKVVYTGVKCVDERNNPLPTEFLFQFDAIRLLAGNFIPIHAALFSKSLLELGCRIDESLDMFEDWDFWLQSSQFAGFLFVDGVSAVYRVNRQYGSGVHLDNTKRNVATLAIFRKWHGNLSDNQVVAVMQAVWDNSMKDSQISALHQAVAERDGKIVGLNQTVAERDGQIASLNQIVAERDGQIVGLNQAVAERDGQIVGLNQAVVERDGIITEKDATIKGFFTSRSWQLTRPLRLIARLIRAPIPH
jgi:glycosyltransferase involved in cell wall biosynthesis